MSQKELCGFYPIVFQPRLHTLRIKKLAVLAIEAMFQNVLAMDYNCYATVNILLHEITLNVLSLVCIDSLHSSCLFYFVTSFQDLKVMNLWIETAFALSFG